MKTFILIFIALLTGLLAEDDKADRKALGRSVESSYRDKVVVVKVGKKDLINQQAFRFFRRTLQRVNDEKARAVVFELNTPGGLAFATTDLMMKDMGSLQVPSYAFVNIEASSAGAFVAVATDTIYMAPLSTIGSAAVVDGSGQKMEKNMRAKVEGKLKSVVRNVTDKRGHNYEVVEAMMITARKAEFGEIKVSKGELLNLSAEQAISNFEGRPLLAKGIAESVRDLLEQEGLSDAKVIEAQMTGFERFSYWVSAFGGMLILVGLGAGYLEMKTPGFGLGAVISIVAFSTFFFGNYVAGNLSGYETAAIFAVGVGFVFLDIFLFPGTFVLGFVGVAMVLGSLFYAMIDGITLKDWQAKDVDLWALLSGPSVALSIGLLGSIVFFALAMKFLPKLPFLNRYLLPTVVDGEAGVLVEEGQDSRIGWTGEAVTDLKPSGKASFEGQILDVTADNHFVSQGVPLRIIKEDGMRIVVKEIPKL